ncbi:RagB/SusD family nutrient uptake outer membrane protein [Bacteroides sp. UBA939]|uniref:RagB/SusD family nutrient uptake outer membrane protein n=1 Tax=Bacteroides sp. UBA939 TaxID=1946092 RepID=UPI0025BA1083|nr:RagB/SusD family nutrient uptake outer membrane protein [Bacteroides sp. UBA939]
MKKNILYILLSVALIFSGCEDFLDTESYTKKNNKNFPLTQEDAMQMTTGIYTCLKTQIGKPRTSHFFVAEIAGDERFGGGSRSNRESQCIDRIQYSEESQFRDFWATCYSAIFRANMAISTWDNITQWDNPELSNQYLGEVYFLRALFYYQMVQIFGQVPLLTNPEPVNKPKASPEELYALITSDLIEAINLLPSKKYDQTESGRATKWAAEAQLARVFLFYTGFYKKDALPTVDGRSINKAKVLEYLNDCIENSGHDLVSDFRNIWAYSNEYTRKDYPYSSENNLQWEGDGCKETLFAIKFGNLADFNEPLGYSNQICLNFALRNQRGGDAASFPYGQGWAIGCVNTTLWEDWLREEPNDLRRQGTIISDELELQDNYNGKEWSTDRSKQVEETRYWGKKYISVLAKDDNGKIWKSYSCLAFNTPENYQLSHTNDLILTRFADVLLMHSELTGTADGINRVRNRVNLPPVQYSMDVLKRERRYELALEGIRWWDLMRWGEAMNVVSAKQEGVNIKVLGKDEKYTSIFKERFRKTNGFFPIPESQIALSNGILEQNPGWTLEDKDAYFENLPY